MRHGLDSLLVELAVHRLDLVLADRPIPRTVSTRAFSHKHCVVLLWYALSQSGVHATIATLGDWPKWARSTQLITIKLVVTATITVVPRYELFNCSQYCDPLPGLYNIFIFHYS